MSGRLAPPPSTYSSPLLLLQMKMRRRSSPHATSTNGNWSALQLESPRACDNEVLVGLRIISSFLNKRLFFCFCRSMFHWMCAHRMVSAARSHGIRLCRWCGRYFYGKWWANRNCIWIVRRKLIRMGSDCGKAGKFPPSLNRSLRRSFVVIPSSQLSITSSCPVSVLEILKIISVHYSVTS